MLLDFRIARTARLVATGFFRTNSRFPAIEQQKYRDQGRSVIVLTMTRPTFFARSSCGSGGKAMNPSIFPSVRRRIDSAEGCVTNLKSLLGSRPTYAAIAARKR